ncbi:hypothetical protein ECH_0596 [Ehrlichia chaffeensis str. Arkansas]|uniref:Uncharacterized protein n=1 Tax=Ehrlichia chaffeensis (strain ATCC CRL-10679 / Arkansas) TaxID=205920 RepID=Q2GGM6_EHRCR|nr:hypothetical protein ECH_0596 [Ehrlichia chaffeensis str. Arkansas]
MLNYKNIKIYKKLCFNTITYKNLKKKILQLILQMILSSKK